MLRLLMGGDAHLCLAKILTGKRKASCRMSRGRYDKKSRHLGRAGVSTELLGLTRLTYVDFTCMLANVYLNAITE